MNSLSEADRTDLRRKLDGWNATATGYRPKATVHELFREVAARMGDRPALVGNSGSLSYAEVERLSDRWAADLSVAGVKADEPVAICMPRCEAAIVAALAVLKAGGAYVPLDPEFPRSRLEFVIKDAGINVLIGSTELATKFAGLARTTLELGIDRVALRLALAAPTVPPLPERTSVRGRAYVMYTSGSTGVPKGVQIEHRSIVRLVGKANYVRLDESVCFLHAAPLGFDASTLEIWGPLLNGGRVVVCSEPLPTGHIVGSLIREHGITSAWLTAGLFNAIVDDDASQLRGLRQLLVGGEALSPSHIRRAQAAVPNVELINGYGPTECTTFTATYSIPNPLPAEITAIPIGRPISDTRVHVLDEHRQCVDVGVEGELYVGGLGLARGYLGRPDLDDERFVDDPFIPGEKLYRTGDLVRWRGDGVLEFVGRADQQVKIRGFRIELGEIEARLAELPEVRAAVVMALDQGAAGKRLVAYVVLKNPAGIAGDLRRPLSALLPDFMIPAVFIKLDSLPVTANGKLNRAALPVPTGSRPELAQDFRAPDGAVEASICKVFADVLGLDRVGSADGFFELGGNSLLVLRLLSRLREVGIGDVSTATFFSAPTPATLAGALRNKTPLESRSPAGGGKPVVVQDEPIAIIGMAGRFPGARDLEAFWENLCAGRESIRVFKPEELDTSIPAAQKGDAAYVRARGVLDDVEHFDAAFFGVAPLEAQLMDPQHRHFLETSWHALEHAGYVPENAPGTIGIFGGMYNATYFQRHLLPRPDMTSRLGDLQVMLGNEKDYVTTRVAHKLGLSGPAVSVNTACSTSLVAAVMAMDNLRRGACDIALAGGVAITCPPNSGYLYQEGSMASPDGHTRPFDAGAAGTVFSDGVAVVVLRRLSDAVAAGDTIYAVMRGAAVNNDGSQRASFTAPSPDGQARVIAAAHDAAGVDARSVSYVEAHGTGTPLGDPIEIEGLTRAFRRHTDECGFCAVGSLKSNVGHLVIAAGAASLIKTALSLHRETLPPSIGFDRPNPQITFSSTPFHVQSSLSSWPRTATPRRAGVSSFGFGGTNAHVVLEEAPLPEPAAPSNRKAQLLLLSGRNPQALDEAAANLRAHLRSAQLSLAEFADLAHTLRVGRRAFAHRRFVVATDADEAIAILSSADAGRGGMRQLGADLPRVCFMAPGQGAQYAAMGRGLYDTEPAFRAAYDDCLRLIDTIMGVDARKLFFADDPAVITPTSITQPAIFCLEYALAALWMSWGIQPQALIGHSVGEFACAVIAGVMQLSDAVALVVERGRRMQELPAGSMLSVRLSAGELTPLLVPGVVIAAENAPGSCVASGPTDAIARIEQTLAAANVVARRLVTSHAFHSPMMDPVIAPLESRLRAIRLRAPRIPIMSTVTADWLSDEQACDPAYWAQHLRAPVRFAPAVAKLLADPRNLLLEIGPRASLSTLARQSVPAGPKRAIPAALPSLGDSADSESQSIAMAAGQLWSTGIAPDWTAYVAHERRRRVPAPGYPFQRQRFWVDAPVNSLIELGAAPEPAVAVPAVESATAAQAAPDDAVPGDRTARLLQKIRDLIEDVSGIEVGDQDPATPWLELGLDSLTLTQVALQLHRAFGVKVTFRQVMEQFGSMSSLVRMLDETLPPEAAAPARPTPAALPPTTTTPQSGHLPLALSSNEDEPGSGPVTYDVKKAFGAIARIHTRADELSAQQRANLDALVARYTKRTARSKAYTAEHRPHMADPRVVNGFRPLTKELTYQIVIERSRGSRLWDIDGNEYVDVLSGFGMSLFGWQADFLREAVHKQVDLGYEIGPQHVLAGETARLFCQLTGADRAAFCNTGSEAVMGAMRIARTVTGRSLIAIFTGAYHGIFDEVIVRGTRKLKSVPAAPGIMPSATQNVLVLDYGTPESLAVLRERAHELAAIVVEPVQSRRPDFQPVEFLRELRALTEASGTLLVFDEVVTGFRAHPRGIQGLFGIQADLASYGKVVGGGFSIGVIAGKRAFMDALDGGHWEFGDDSIPTVGVTYFAGTFVRHPLALAAAKAALQHMLDAGPGLQQRLTARTAAMVSRINQNMRELGAPFKLNTFASLWRNVFTEDLPYGDLIYAMLRDRGIHILDNFPCFLTTAHSDEDIDRIVRAYSDAAREMLESGFFPRRDAPAPALPLSAIIEAPSTEQQREVWLADRLGTESSLAYNESISLHLRGELDVGALRHAMRDLIARHQSLRATFSEDGTVFRVHATRPDLAIPMTDAGADADGGKARLAAVTARHVSEPFDLEHGPLLRAELLRLSADHHVLVLTAHHIIVDGWSFWILVKDLGALYGQIIGARSAQLEPAPDFVDYARALHARADSPEVGENVAWWVDRFKDGGPTLDLPVDRPRQRVRTQAAGRYDHLLSATLTAQVKKLGASQGASMFATLVAAFAALLNRLTGQKDLVVGIPAAGQSSAELPGLVGHCVSTLPLRMPVDRTDSFQSLLKVSRSVMLDAYDHQDVTFGRVLRELPIVRDPGRLPLISVVFNIDQALSSESVAMPGLHLELASNPRVFETFELFINAVDNGAAGMRLECQYNSDLFDEPTVQRWMQGMELMLAGAVQAPASRIGDLPLITRQDLESLAGWNCTTRSVDADVRIESLVLEQIARTPQRMAVEAGVQSLTYGELGQRIGQIAAALRAAGVQHGHRVGLLLERDMQLPCAMLGILRAGATYVPLDPAFPAERLAFMLKDSDLRVVLTTAALAQGHRSAIDRVPAVLIDSIGAPVSDFEAGAADSSDDAYVIYTSGSTGNPKGVRIQHRSVVNFLSSMRRIPGIAPETRLAAVTTISFDIAGLELLLPLVCGATVVVVDRDTASDGVALSSLLSAKRVNLLQATPATWRLLLSAGWRGSADFRAISGGEALPPELAGALLERVSELWNLYGPTETTIWSSAYRVLRADSPIPIGRPIDNTVMHVLDEDGQLAPVGVTGELYIGGAGVARGYLGRPELTAERFVPDSVSLRLGGRGVPAGERLYRTGDLARWQNAGVLECLGRVDFQVKVRGYRIELGEIESRLNEYPGVAQSVVSAREDRPGDVRLVAYVVPRQSAVDLDEHTVREHLAKVLPDYMLPQHLVMLDAIPLTPNAKVDRRALPPPAAAAGRDVNAGGGMPRSPTEEALVALFESVLARQGVGIHTDFFVFGGHSLLAAQLTARLGRDIGRSVPMRVLFEHPTVAGLAAWLQESAPERETRPHIPPRASQQPAPLSLMQQRVWYIEQLQPGRSVFNVPSAHRLRGELDLLALRHAFNEMIARQPVLRTSIGEVGGEPVQITASALDYQLELEELPGETREIREAVLVRRLEQEVGRPFVLSVAPLFRARLFRLDMTEHVLFFMPHHIIWDGWSFDVFYEEMAALYAARRDQCTANVPALRIDYADFAVWHRGWMAGPELERQVTYWRDKLAGAPFVLDIPLDRPRPASQSGEGATCWLKLPPATADALRKHSTDQGSTLFMTLLAVWALLLHRLSGQPEVVIGTPVRGRNDPDLESVMGFFVNALPLRLRVNANSSFEELLRHVRSEVVDAFGCQDVPFEHLVRVLDLPRDEGRFPVYQAFFSYQDARRRSSAWGNLQHENMPVFQPAAAQDVALWFLDGADGIVGGLNYNTDILRRESAELMSARYLELLEAVAHGPALPLHELMSISPAEMAQLQQWNATQAPLTDCDSLAAYLISNVQRWGSKTAVRHGAESISYAQLDEQSSRIAAALRAAGMSGGDVIGIHMQRSPRMLASILGVLRAGGCYLPLDPDFPAARIEFMLADSKARLLIADDAAVPPGFDSARVLKIGDALAHATPWQEPANVAGVAERAAYVIYTSGSTGTPKGVCVPHRAVINFLESMRREPGLASDARLAAVTTISFDIAVLELFLPITMGAEILLVDREQATDGAALRRLLEEQRVDVMQATPATWRLLVESGWRGSARFKALCGGEALPVDLAEALLDRVGELWNMYGPTETTVWSTCGRIEAGQDDISIGKPIANTQVWILGEDGRPAPIGIPGELCIGGAGVAIGYHERPDLTLSRFVADTLSETVGGRLYKTGDLARWRTDGVLQHLGRTDLQVKVRGYRIELGEIEVALGRAPHVEQAVVVAAAAGAGDVRLIAYLVCRPDATVDPAAMRERLRGELPDYMIPSAFITLDQLPMTANGKIDRKSLAGRVPAITTTGSLLLQEPRTPTEILLAEIWRGLLNCQSIGVNENFLDLGGHSLLIMRAVAAIESRCGVRLSPRAMVFQSLGQVAAEIDRAAPGGAGEAASIPVAPQRGSSLLRRVLRSFRSEKGP